MTLTDWKGRTIPQGWKALCDIPNQAGKLVLVLLADSKTTIKTKVRRSNTTGLHTLIGVRMSNCLAWQDRTL